MSVGSDLVLCMVSADRTLVVRVSKADWLICLWRSAANVFTEIVGNQALFDRGALSPQP